MDEGQSTAPPSLTATERDRLYRDWLLPALPLAPAHREFLQTVWHLAEPRDFHSYPGPLKLPVDPRAPVDALTRLGCGVVRGQYLHVAGPREGGLLVPVSDPAGHLLAFHVFSASELARLRSGTWQGRAHWWRAAGVPNPALPNGEAPLHAARVRPGAEVVLAHGVAAASIIAQTWQMNAVSTADDSFGPQTLAEYLTEFQPATVAILLGREPGRAVAQRAWDLCRLLQERGWQPRLLVPVLSDQPIPEHYGDCTLIAFDTWLGGLPQTLQNQLLDRDVSGQLSEHLRQLNEERHLTATTKIRLAYDDLRAQGHAGTININVLARTAGVAWMTVHAWLAAQGIGDTGKLRQSVAAGWEPPIETPALTPASQPEPPAPPAPEAAAEAANLPLFEFAAAEERRAQECRLPAPLVPVAPPAPPPAAASVPPPPAAPPPSAPPTTPPPSASPPPPPPPPSAPRPNAAPSVPETRTIVVQAEEATPGAPAIEITAERIEGTGTPAGEEPETVRLKPPQAAAGGAPGPGPAPTPDRPSGGGSPPDAAPQSLRQPKVIIVVGLAIVLLLLIVGQCSREPEYVPRAADAPTETELRNLVAPQQLPLRTLPLPRPGTKPPAAGVPEDPISDEELLRRSGKHGSPGRD